MKRPAKRASVRFHPQRGVKRIVGRDGHVSAVELVGVVRTYDEDGRFAPVYDQSVSETLEAETVILAIGQQADLSFLKPEDGIEITSQGTIRVDPETLATSTPGVFAGGDVAFGPRNLIEAIANGKRAALSIDNYLRQVTGAPVFRLSVEKIPTRAYERASGYERFEREAPATIPLGRRTGISEVETGYSESEARQQAQRCLYCHIQTIYNAERCVLCNRCVDICPEHCLQLVPVQELDLDQETKQKLASHYNLQAVDEEQISAMVKDDEKCIRCGLCATRCPTDAMTMEVFFYEESESAAEAARQG